MKLYLAAHYVVVIQSALFEGVHELLAVQLVVDVFGRVRAVSAANHLLVDVRRDVL